MGPCDRSAAENLQRYLKVHRYKRCTTDIHVKLDSQPIAVGPHASHYKGAETRTHFGSVHARTEKRIRARLFRFFTTWFLKIIFCTGINAGIHVNINDDVFFPA